MNVQMGHIHVESFNVSISLVPSSVAALPALNSTIHPKCVKMWMNVQSFKDISVRNMPPVRMLGFCGTSKSNLLFKTIGSFNCHCISGYKLGADGRHCDGN